MSLYKPQDGASHLPIMVWGPHLATGSPLIDEDHRELIRLINEFASVQDEPKDSPRTRQAIDALAAYATGHFEREETMMARAAIDPRHVQAHTNAHQGFIRYVKQIQASPHSLFDIVQFLTRWLNIHILGVDHALGRQIRLITQGMEPAEAFEVDTAANKDPAMVALHGALHSVEAEAARERVQRERLLVQMMDGDPVPTFVINAHHRITHWNRAVELVTGRSAAEMVGSTRQWAPFHTSERPTLADLIVDQAVDAQSLGQYGGPVRASRTVPDAFEAERFFPHLGTEGVWLHFTAAPLRDTAGQIVGAIETLQDISERRRAEDQLHEYQKGLESTVLLRTEELARSNAQLADDIRLREAAEGELLKRYEEMTALYAKLSKTQEQLLQSEKMASIGQLAAGVAHEINNPIGFVFSNIGSLETYVESLLELLDRYSAAEAELSPATLKTLKKLKEQLELDYLREDLPVLMTESKEGIERVKQIVQDLKDFSHVDRADDWQVADLHRGIDSTLNIVNNEIKYKASIVKEYGDLPEVECLPSQINQVVMNLAVNAAQAMGERHGRITIRTGREGLDSVWIEVEDNGAGIPEEIRHKIFDPFFTTKPVGKGTGLGLSLSYGIVQRHHGSLDVRSETGQGSTFRITLPLRQAARAEPRQEHA